MKLTRSRKTSPTSITAKGNNLLALRSGAQYVTVTCIAPSTQESRSVMIEIIIGEIFRSLTVLILFWKLVMRF